MSDEYIKIAILIAIILWTLPWKVVALWKSARNTDRVWFAVLLVVNTLAILDIIYILFFSKREKNDF
jgi:hypothetical protein